MPSVIHFEVAADDVERAKVFYQELFDWKLQEIPEMEYWLITTGDEDAVGGGLMKRQHPNQNITNYIGVSSVSEYASRAEELGGKIVVPKTAVPGMGYFVICLDTEKNPFGFWEDDQNAK